MKSPLVPIEEAQSANRKVIREVEEERTRLGLRAGSGRLVQRRGLALAPRRRSEVKRAVGYALSWDELIDIV